MKRYPTHRTCTQSLRTVVVILLGLVLLSPAGLSQAPVAAHTLPVVIKVDIKHQDLERVFRDVLQLKEGKVGAILEKFDVTNSPWRWTIREGDLPRTTNALTEVTRDGVVTTLHYANLARATKLSVARTLVHEMIHAYLVWYFRYEPANAAQEYPRMVAAYRYAASTPDLNDVHHQEMAHSFVIEIAVALREYGRRLHLQVPDATYTDLAWGGLDFRNNDRLADENKERIQQRLRAEQSDAPVFMTQPVGPVMGE